MSAATANLRRYWKTAEMEATSGLDSQAFVGDYGLRFLRVVVFLSIWRSIWAGKGVVSGMTLASVLTYTLMAEAASDMLACDTHIDWELWQGQITLRFLRPMGLFRQFTAKMVGRWLPRLCFFSVPLLLVSPLLGVDPLPAAAGAGVLAVLSLALAISVGLALDFLWGALTVSAGRGFYTVTTLRNAVTMLLSGAVIPLALFPWGVGEVLGFLPFASVASAPLCIYTGTGDAAPLLLLQACWSIVLWPLTTWAWRLSRERAVSFGG